MKTVGIAGGSGFVGRHLAKLLIEKGYQVIIFSRSKKPSSENLHFATWQPDKQQIDREALAKVDAMVNLAGAGVADRRWTANYKKEILSSRVDATYFLLKELRAVAQHCAVYIASSATGIYGPDRSGSIPFTETSPPYTDFLAEVCKQWEKATMSADSDYRTVILRFGIVLGQEDGAYKALTDPMKFGVVPIIGGGAQMVSWAHIDDVASMLHFALENQLMSGVYNCVAPEVVSHRDMMKTIGRVKGGLKILVPVPAFVLKIIMGESSIEVLKSCTSSAEKVIAAGFNFRYPLLEEAIEDLEQK